MCIIRRRGSQVTIEALKPSSGRQAVLVTETHVPPRKWYVKYIPKTIHLVCALLCLVMVCNRHDDVIKWKYFPRHWPFLRGIHRLPVTSPHKGQWRGALMFSLIRAWINGWVNNREDGDLRRYRAHYDVIVMWFVRCCVLLWFATGKFSHILDNP